MKEALNIITPEITMTITVRHLNPWFTKELRIQKKIVRRRETIYKKYGQHQQWVALRGERTKYKQMIWNSQKEKLSNKVLDARCNTKQLYNLVSNLTSTQHLNPLPEYIPNEELADRFADYFIENIITTWDSLVNYPSYCPTWTPTGSSLAAFKPYMEEEIMEIIKSVATKSCESDAIHTQFLKGVLPLIITLLKTLINLALDEGIFAETWKELLSAHS